MGKLPDFTIAGFAKCGTTSLIINLNKHSKIHCISFKDNKNSKLDSKESDFFCINKYYNKGLEWYKNHFNGYEDLICGEKSTRYIDSNIAIERIAKDVPNIKIILCLRDPVKRFLSQVNMKYMNKKIQGYGTVYTIEQAMGMSNYIGRGFYSKKIKKLYNFFPKEQIYLSIVDEVSNNIDRNNIVKSTLIGEGVISGYVSKDISNNSRNTLEPIINFLGLKWEDSIKPNFYFVGKYEINPSEKIIQQIKNKYKDSNEELFEMLGRKIESWL